MSLIVDVGGGGRMRDGDTLGKSFMSPGEGGGEEWEMVTHWEIVSCPQVRGGGGGGDLMGHISMLPGTCS